MSKRFNPLSNHSVEKSRELYEAIGLCYECGTRAATCKHAEQRSRAATCSICTLAPVMRHCDGCAFQQPIAIVFVATDVSTDNIVQQNAESVLTISQ